MSEGINTNTPGGKLVFHILIAVAEFSCDVIVEKTCAGLDAALARAPRLDRPPVLSIDDVLEAHRQIVQAGTEPTDIARRFDVHPITFRRAFAREGLLPSAA